MTKLYILTGPAGSGKTTYLKTNESIKPIDFILDDNGEVTFNKHIPHHPIFHYKIDHYVFQNPTDKVPFQFRIDDPPLSHKKINESAVKLFNKYKNQYNPDFLSNLISSIIPALALDNWGYCYNVNKPWDKPSFEQLSNEKESNVYFATKLPYELLADFKETFSEWSEWIDIEIIQFPLQKGN